MTLTKAKIEKIHPVYRDFLMALKPIIDSRPWPFPTRVMSATQIYDASVRKYGYDPERFYKVARNLLEQKLIEFVGFGYYKPTARGEELIREIYRTLVGGEPDPGESVPTLDLEGLWDGE